MKTIPLVVYVNGERKIVGEAVVDIINDYVDITAKIDLEYIPDLRMEQLRGISLGPFSI